MDLKLLVFFCLLWHAHVFRHSRLPASVYASQATEPVSEELAVALRSAPTAGRTRRVTGEFGGKGKAKRTRYLFIYIYIYICININIYNLSYRTYK